jgi:TIR domain-containing protein
MARDVFISHSARDKAVADAVCAALEAAALRCWVAPRDVRPGHSFAGEITRAIRQSKVMVLIFSGHSNTSEQVLREVQLATDCHLPIVRFRIEDVALTDDLTYFLSSPHWLDALTPPLSKHIATLELAVKELLGQSAEDPGRNVVSSMVPPKKSTQKEERETVVEKASNRWKLLAIAAVVLLAAIVTLILLWQPARPGIHKYESAPGPTSPPARTPEPTPSPTSQPVPTAESTHVAASPSLAPRSSNGTNQLNNAGPAPRNNRTWKAWIDDFVHQYVRSGESNDADLAASFFAPTVDLLEEGVKPLDSIRRDTEAYNARWPTRRATIRGDVQISEKAPDRGYAASFQADYYVENPARGEWINVAVSVDLQIAVSDGLPRITSLKQKTLRREKGTMQPR